MVTSSTASALNFHHLRYFWVTVNEGSVTRAAKILHVTQPTVSEQLSLLEQTLGEKLFQRDGRRLHLTDVGKTVMRFADEIFSLGSDLVDTVRGQATGRPTRLAVGISESVPKVVAHQILEPVLAMEATRIICEEDVQERLLVALAAHELDMLITDEPVSSKHAHVFSHLLGECGVSVFGTKPLPGFPQALDGAPMLLPSPGTAHRREIDMWLEGKGVKPRIVGEFADPALMTVFAQEGAGFVVLPDAMHGLKRVGAMKPLTQKFYVITVERRLINPAVQRVTSAARRAFGAKKK